MNTNVRRMGRIGQTGIYLGKLFRMFVFQNDWTLLIMAAIIAFLVSKVVAKNLFLNMEGTLIGAFAITCVCIWNGCFNSIQSICRERAIVKREHRSGVHMSSYVAAHMIYQAFLCLCQTWITIYILRRAGVEMPTESYVDLIFDADTEVFITIFLITYSASIIALFVSSIVKNPTKAMAFMPFFLIFQLIFSGGFFQLSDDLMKVSYITVSKWGLNAICAQGDFNDQNMVTPMNTLVKMKGLEVTGDEMARMTNLMLQTHEVNDVEIVGNEIITPDESMTVVGFTENDTYMPLSGVVDYLEANPEAKENMMQRFGEQNYNANYESSQSNVLKCWMCLIGFIVLFASMSTVSLEFIDRDRR